MTAAAERALAFSASLLAWVIAIAALAYLCGCTHVRVETSEGTTLEYSYPALFDKSWRYERTADGVVIEHNTTSDPAVEILREAGKLAAAGMAGAATP
jgi:hypothetical protein